MQVSVMPEAHQILCVLHLRPEVLDMLTLKVREEILDEEDTGALPDMWASGPCHLPDM